MDARGYDASSRPGQEAKPTGKPLSNSHEVARDIDRSPMLLPPAPARIGLLGWATGGHWAGMYASRRS